MVTLFNSSCCLIYKINFFIFFFLIGIIPLRSNAQCVVNNADCVGGDCEAAAAKAVEYFDGSSNGTYFGTFSPDVNTAGYVYGNITSNTDPRFVRKGAYSVKHSLYGPIYPHLSKRAELGDNNFINHPRTDANGNKYYYWYGWSYFVPDEPNWNIPGFYQFIGQFRSNNGLDCFYSVLCDGTHIGGSGSHMFYSNGNMYFNLIYQDDNCPGEFKVGEQQFNLGKMPKGVWMDFVVEADWTHLPTGFIKMWVQKDNGGYVLVMDHTGPNWIDKYSSKCGVSNMAGITAPSPNWQVGLYYSNDSPNENEPRYLYSDEGKTLRTLCPDGPGSDGWNKVIPASGAVYTSTAVYSVSVTPPSSNMQIGQTLQLDGTISPVNATNKTILWSSSNNSVATVDANGLVTALSGGTVTITASSADGTNKTATCSIYVFPSNQLVARYNFDNNGFDTTGNKYQGAVNVGVSYSNVDYKQGSHAAYFDGTAAAFMSVGDDLGLRISKNITLSSWVKTSAVGIGQIISKDGNNGYRFRLNATNQLNLIIGITGSTNVLQCSSNAVVPAGEWHHVAVTASFSGNVCTVRFYIDGVLKDTLTMAASEIEPGSGPLVIGANGLDGGQPLLGYLDDVRIYNYALSNSEIMSIASTTVPSSVSLSPTPATVDNGKTIQLTATVLPVDATNKNVKWSSSNTDIATVDNNGLVAGLAVGTTTITATTYDGAKTSNSVVTVNYAEVPVTSVGVMPISTSINIGATTQLNATILPTNATNKLINWSSSNELVATVNSSGLVAGVSEGEATITATTVDGSKIASSKITVYNSLVGRWRFENNANDETGLYNGTLVKDAAFSTSTKVEGNYSFYSTSGSDCITVSDAPGLRVSSNMTIAAWVYSTVSGVHREILSKSGNTGYRLRINSSNFLNLLLGKDALGSVVQTTCDVVFPTGGWHHAAVTASFNGTICTTKYYYDGVLKSTKTSTISAIYGGTGQLIIGAFTTTGTENLKGNLDDLCIYSRTLSDSEISALVAKTSLIPVSGVSVNPATADIVVGSTITVTSSVAPENASNKVVNWSSSNSNVAAVSANGIVNAIGTGNATITATTADGNKTASTLINVLAGNVPVTGIFVNPTSAILTVGGNSQLLVASIIPSNATNQNINWESNNPSVATVSSTGVVNPVSVGSAIITATAVDGGSSVHASVSVINSPTNFVSPKQNDKILTIYPNPAKSNIGIDLIGFSNGELTIVDITGKEIYRKEIVGNSHLKLNINNINAGAYFVKVDDGQTIKSQKLIVLK